MPLCASQSSSRLALQSLFPIDWYYILAIIINIKLKQFCQKKLSLIMMPENGDTEYGENGNHEVFGYGQLGEIGFVSVCL